MGVCHFVRFVNHELFVFYSIMCNTSTTTTTTTTNPPVVDLFVDQIYDFVDTHFCTCGYLLTLSLPLYSFWQCYTIILFLPMAFSPNVVEGAEE
jgi:hypothetical protein